MPDDRDVSGQLIKYGRIAGLDEIKYERTLEIVPSVTVGQTGERVAAREIAAGRFVNHSIKKQIGVNLKYTISPNVTLDATFRPDFAEIEADAPVVTANQRFPIFFQEKRPFFLEGKEIFDSPLVAFYSRTIIAPDVAVKLTGKIDKTSFGFLAASDKAPGNYSEDERTQNRECLLRQLKDPRIQCPLNQFIDKNALFGILRVKRDFGSNNNIGFYATARVFPQNRNFVGGFDGTFKLNNSTVMKFQALGTHSLKNFYDPNTDSSRYRNGNGFGYLWNLDHTKETHGWFAEIYGRTKDYRADAGFTRRTNTNQATFENRFSTKSNPKSRFIRFDWNQFVKYTFDWAGRTQYALAGTGLNIQMQGNVFLNIEGGDQTEHLYEEEFGAKRNPLTGLRGAFFGAPERTAQQPYITANANKTFNKQFNMYAFVGSVWGAFDFDFGAGNRYQRVSPAYTAWIRGGQIGPYPALDPGPGRQFEANVGFQYKPIDPLRISLDYTNSHLRRNDNRLLAYDTNIYTLRSTYQFTRFVFVRARWDYDTLQANASGQMLLGWNPNPGTAFYVGYNDNFNYHGYNPFTANLEPGFARNSRTFFIRASYLFRKSF